MVMTTEVLRNMLYADSPTLQGLGFVVMDEVHYLADRFRGAVWEEVIIHLAGVGAGRLAVGHGEQRRGVRRLAGHRPRRHRGDRRGAPAGAAVAARHGPRPADGPVRAARGRRPARRRRRQPRAGRDDPRAGAPAAGVALRHPVGPGPRPSADLAARRVRPRRRPRRPEPARRPGPARAQQPAAGDHLHLQPGRLRRRRPAVPALRACGSPRRRRPRRSARTPRSTPPTWPSPTSASWATGSGSTAWSTGWPPTTPGCCRPSRRWSSTCSPAA